MNGGSASGTYSQIAYWLPYQSNFNQAKLFFGLMEYEKRCVQNLE